MYNNRMWIIFISIILVSTCIYTAMTLYRYYNYERLTSETTMTGNLWFIQKAAEDSYLISVTYTFKAGNREFTGTDSWQSEPYRNEEAAEYALKEYRNSPWKVFFDPNDPKHSTLQKSPPIKQYLSTFILWGICFYFFWLGIKMRDHS